MRIQIISDNTEVKRAFSDNQFFVTSFSAPFAMEAFDLTIIDFQNVNTWTSDGKSIYPLNCNSDLLSIREIIDNSDKTLLLIALPLNYKYKYHRVNGTYYYYGFLKDSIDTTQKTINSLVNRYGNFSWYYENNVTSLNDQDYLSEFSFDKGFSFYSITKANGSESLTTLCVDEKLYLTSLNIMDSKESALNYLTAIGILPKESDYPSWLFEYSFYNDASLKAQLQTNNDKIKDLEIENKSLQLSIVANLEYKSILSSTGNQLVESVFRILEALLDCDLSLFEDKKNEDFSIDKDNCIFVGEIKGISANVKRQNLSQIELHCQRYLDENDIDKPVKGLLIINHQRKKPIEDREPIHEDQINLAKSYGVLIIETVTLLKLYDQYLNKQISSKEIIELFEKNTGLFLI